MAGSTEGEKGKLASSDEFLAECREVVDTLVRYDLRISGGKMNAYVRIAERMGKSEGWVRRVLGGRVEIAVTAEDFRNLVLLYHELCIKLEEEARTQRQLQLAFLDLMAPGGGNRSRDGPGLP